ncbi:Regulator of telomere elongation helicase 1 [Dermatophagoides pteronyssinus]|uniref:Regulator of telomere elongation helicase 1 n=1 Tax=Dermatophagoides pteronyssinus TaxID=6956 RepID=A0ABQ8JB53_DERPT|nr:Regulator of telomere elongation helicase 1 [Dermatophagoides pteronyssinus]
MDIDIGGITVIFPFKPYDIQVDYMNAVIKALNERQNALLESPTGTGKTLSLLCSTLAWLESRKFLELDSKRIEEITPKNIVFPEDLIISDKDQTSQKEKKKNGKKGWKQENRLRIIYSSRTHSQLNQASNELKNSYYNFCPSVTIGSRDQLCINPDVMNLEHITAKNQTCRHKVKNNLCSYHHNYERKVSDLSFCGSKIYDIEDLIAFGNEHKACPYYMSKALTDYNTSLTFMPYNYILDPSIRKTLKLNLENTIIIFDEGHNIERVCEDSMSTELKSETLVLFLRAFDLVLQSLKELKDGKYDDLNSKELSDLDMHDVAKVKLIICNLEEELDRLVKKQDKGSHDTHEIFNILHRVNLNHEHIELVTSICEKINTVVMSATTAYLSNQTIAALSSVCSFLEIVQPFTLVKEGETLSSKKLDFIKNYKLYTEIDKESHYQKTWLNTSVPNGWTVYLWCMSPSVAIQSLKRAGIYNLIITSGTLSPLESFELEMGIPFKVKLQNSHVISDNQLSIQLIAKDPNGHELRGSYDRRDDLKYYSGLGYTILAIAKKVPKGMFIFFSSYSLINRCIEEWKSRKLWTSISSVKKIFVEPKNKREFNPMIESFKYACDQTPEGAIFMGVARGKLSEGMDLSDNYCRAVMIISLPYPARFDPKVVLKEKYLNENKCRLTGSQWYILQMKRALNQSVGRVIRHKNDYGLIILCDSRFQALYDGFSRWILPFFNRQNACLSFSQQIQQIDQFFSRSSAVCDVIEYKNEKPVRLPQPKRELKVKQTNQNDDDDNDNEIQNVFSNMVSDYTKIKDKLPVKPKMVINKNNDTKLSIFDSFEEEKIISKRKKNSFADECNKKSRSSSEENDPPDEKETDDHQSIKQKGLTNDRSSKYFTKPFTSPVKEQVKPKDVFDLGCTEIIDIKETILKNEQSIQAFEMILNHIMYQPGKCRQLCETLRVYGKKRNSIYLAMRLNFILENIRGDKRNIMLKDLSNLIPEAERKLFLRTCKVE